MSPAGIEQGAGGVGASHTALNAGWNVDNGKNVPETEGRPDFTEVVQNPFS